MAQRIRNQGGALCTFFGITPAQLADALCYPQRWIPVWQERLKRAERRQAQHQVAKWKRKLTTRGHRPTRALFKWLRQGPGRGHFVTTVSGKAVVGPHDFFKAHTAYWEGLMTRQQEEATEAHTLLAQLPSPEYLTHLDSGQVQLLHEAVCALKPWASSGLDSWPPSALVVIPVEAIRPLAWLYYTCELAKMWPRNMLDIRVQVIPKTNDPAAPPSGYRPISITSVWYRAWSSWVLRRLPSRVWDCLDKSACGGLPHRSPHAPLLEIMLEIEQSLNKQQDRGWLGIVSLDAVKCFDLLSYPLVVQCCIRVGLPQEILALLLSFWLNSTRYISAHRFVSGEGFQTWNGVPQGCAMSVMMCVCMVMSWTQQTRIPGVKVLSFVDDRYIHTRDPDAYREAWEKSETWHKEYKWRIHPEKSCTVQVAGPEVKLSHEGVPLPRKNVLLALGTETPTHMNRGCEQQAQRLANAAAMVDRLSLMNLPVHVVQKLLGICIMPKAVYALIPRLPTQGNARVLTNAIKKAMGVWKRRASWEANCALIGRPCTQDPISASMYVHMTTILRVRRQQKDFEAYWQRLKDDQFPGGPKGPWSLWHSVLRDLQVTEEAGRLRHREEEIEIFSTPWAKIKCFLGRTLQQRLLRIAAGKRPNMAGADEANLKLSLKNLRAVGGGAKVELIQILTDGLWTQKIRAKFDGTESGLCTFCGMRRKPQPIFCGDASGGEPCDTSVSGTWKR